MMVITDGLNVFLAKDASLLLFCVRKVSMEAGGQLISC
jgi:hypothetical protein